MKSAIKTVKDIMSGAVVTTKKGNQYIVLRDDAGNPAMYSKKGCFVRLDSNGLTDTKGKHEIQKIEIFATMPQADQISEALKYIYTGREACAELTTVFVATNPELEAKKAKAEELERKIEELESQLDSVYEDIEDMEYED